MNPENPSMPSTEPSASTPNSVDQPKNKSNFFGKFRGFSSGLLLILSAPILALFLTAHVFQPYEVDGISMETTLQNGDRLIVFKLPKTISNITNDPYVPSRWDVIVFDKPRSLSAPSTTEHLIKRVIGLPGERVVVSDGKVTVYNRENQNGFDPDLGKEYSKDILQTDGNVDITVGQSELFVMGDNRANSTDSRIFGAIPEDIVVGPATARFVPVNSMKRL